MLGHSGQVMGHSGSTFGVSAWTGFLPNDNLGIVVLSNTRSVNPGINVLGCRVIEKALGLTPGDLPESASQLIAVVGFE